MNHGDNNQLAVRHSAQAMVEAYLKSVERIKAAYAELRDIENNLNEVFANDGYLRIGTLPRPHGLDEANERNLNRVLSEIKRNVWLRLYALLEIERSMTPARAEEMRKKIESDDMPDIAEQTVFEILETLRQNASAYADELVSEAYALIKSADKKYKTNEANQYEVKDKVIFRAWSTTNKYVGAWSMYDYARENLLTLDRVFHALDGKSVKAHSYQSPLIDAVNLASKSDGEVETDYFRVAAKKNGNAHIKFKRADLVARMNQIVGVNTLKPKNT